MVRLAKAFLATAITAAAVVSAQDKIVAECGRDLGKCPEHKPCCSQYGLCGIGAYCLGGCDPLFSTTLDSCVPAPVCKSKTSTFENLDKVVSNFKYLGDSGKYDWVVEGKPVLWDNNLLLTMAEGTVGTVLSSTTAMWYGKATAKLKTSRGKGVVSSFILFSGVKDEIDFEWIGVDLNQVQTNYYFQGIPTYTNGGNSSVDGSTYDEYHTYEIDWTPDAITWLVDGKVSRVKKRSETWNEKTKSYDFPQTPSRVQLSLWPGGLPSNAEGTIKWAGGVIEWDHPDVKEAGYYYVTIKEIKTECYNPPKGARKEGSKSYVYDDISGLESAVKITDKDHILKSFLGSGTDMDKVPESKPTDPNSPKPTEEVETIPGLSGGGTGSGDYKPPGEGENGGTDNQDGNDNGLGDDGTLDFKQNGVNDNKNLAANQFVEKGSILAVVIAVAFCLVL